MSRGEQDSLVLSLGKMDVSDAVLLYRIMVFELSRAAQATAHPPVTRYRTDALLSRVRLVQHIEDALIKAGRQDVLNRAVWGPDHVHT